MIHSETVCYHVVAASGEAYQQKYQQMDRADFIERNRSTRPYAAWLRDTLEKLPTWPNSRIDELLPFARTVDDGKVQDENDG